MTLGVWAIVTLGVWAIVTLDLGLLCTLGVGIYQHPEGISATILVLRQIVFFETHS